MDIASIRERYVRIKGETEHRVKTFKIFFLREKKERAQN